ncbi:hypothetical protein FRC12_015446 [Ceratobasidium sp. 428]|nr:hypothetical protein FRC12_015446 [Ceratobasidium sp. 428]
MYAPHERSIYPAAALPPTQHKHTDPLAPPLDDFGLLVRSQPVPSLPRPAPVLSQPAPAPAPAPTPAVPPPPLQLALPLVSDDYTADLELAHQLMQSDEENFQAAALDSLRLEDVVPGRAQNGAKYAYAPSRARASRGQRPRQVYSISSPRYSTHSSPANSSVSRGLSLPAIDEFKPQFHETPPLRPSQSHPVLSSQPHPLREHFSKAQVKLEVVEAASEPGPSSSSPAPTPLVPSTLPTPTPVSSVGSSAPGSGGSSAPPPLPPPPPPPPPADLPPNNNNNNNNKRPARTPKRSPAPRRQECKMCGKKFQRPCQLTTHIRSHTGEQPHACPVCSRRFSVLSNCQRHVKLCQKRSAKVVSPGDDDLNADSTGGPSGASSSFIPYPDTAATDESARRPNEVPIRPKPASHGSSGNSLVGVGPAALERSVSVGSSGVEGGEGVGIKVEPSGMVVASSSAYSYSESGGYDQPSGSSGFGGYDESGSTFESVRPSFEHPQTIYEEPASEYSSSGPSFDAAGSGFDAARSTSYDTVRANAGYEPSTSGAYGHAGPGYDSIGSSQYGPSESAYGQSGPAYEQAGSSGAEYSQQSAAEYGPSSAAS